MNIVAVIGMLVLGQDSPGAPLQAAAAPLGIDSVFDFVVKGGWPMIPIGACSLVALAIIVERAIMLRKGRVVPRGFVTSLGEMAGDRKRAIEYCRDNRSPIAVVLEAAIVHADEPIERLEKHVEEAGQREVLALRHHMRLLSVLPQVSTMLGLLGTVFGMIKTFQAVALTSEALGKTEMLAKGIFEAWTCTAAGLLIAIPVMIAYHSLMGRIDSLVVEIDRAAVSWLEAQKVRAGRTPQLARESRNSVADHAASIVVDPV